MPIPVQPTHAGSRAIGAKVLLVDDDQELTEALALALQLAGFRPLRAASLPAALGQFESERPDLAVLDVNLGAWSGLDLLEQLRTRSSVPIIMLTGSVSEQLEVRSIELGADDILIKPIGTGYLVTRIRARLAQNRRAAEQLEVHVQLNTGLRELVETGDRLLCETQQAVRARDNLLAVLAHDLQPPLFAIQHLAKRRLLRLAHVGKTIDPLVHALEQIEDRAVHMAEGLDQLLALAGLEFEGVSAEDLGQAGQSVEVRGVRHERILVVEDDETIRTAVMDLLNRDGYVADGASDGEQALAKLHVQPADAIVLDLRMPVMDGWTFVETPREFPSL